MRSDSIGLFWEDLPKIRKTKEIERRTPPEPVWLSPDYLPYLEEAREYNVEEFNEQTLTQARDDGEVLVYDIESYSNYTCICFKSVQTRRVLVFEFDEYNCCHNPALLLWVVKNFTTVGFYSRNYDNTILAIAVNEFHSEYIHHASNMLIQQNFRSYEVLRDFKVKAVDFHDHIDVIEVAPSACSLKLYSGRLHSKRMQDLPFHPDAALSYEQKLVTRWYCINDLDCTIDLFLALEKPLKLRRKMSEEYDLKLMSKSDAQIAEAILSNAAYKLRGIRAERPVVPAGARFKYKVPHFLEYKSETMKWTLDRVRNAEFVVSEFGKVMLPEEISELVIPIGGSAYRMGIGGLHSTEKCVSHVADADTTLIERDVTSYYPFIILNLLLAPPQFGHSFIQIYRDIVERRLTAKRAGDKATADSLKITINGSFGKLSSPHSVLYSPHLLIQVTITGQLALLMLIEMIELAGIPVVSGNTDGIVIKCPNEKLHILNKVVKEWEDKTEFQTEEEVYRALYSRDVNNYIAVKMDEDECKVKGIFAKPGLSKNPNNWICIEAIKEFLLNKTPVEQTILNNKDIRNFLTVRTVKGGAVKDGEYLGKAIRWYYSTEDEGEIVYAKSGNKVPRSETARPCMTLPDEFPADVNFDWYIGECYKIMAGAGFETPETA